MVENLILTLNTSEIQILVRELKARAEVLGIAEVERRIGRPLDVEKLFSIESGGNTGAFRIAPTVEFDRILELLWK
jgi:hypothetical protein